MAVTCPIGFDAKRLRSEVSEMYARVAAEPSGDFHFHRGPDYAANLLGYSRTELAQIPNESTDSFAGVANPFSIHDISPGETVLDVGCGAGMDLLLAARKVGPTGLAIGIDMTPAMLERASTSAKQMGLSNVNCREGDAEALPVDSETVDTVISNGVLNLTTDKTQAFSEIFRVLCQGGRLQLADIAVETELSEGIRNDIDLWSS